MERHPVPSSAGGSPRRVASGRITLSGLLFILALLTVVTLAGYHELGPCDAAEGRVERFLRIRVAGCAPELVTPASDADHWHLDPSAWFTVAWERPAQAFTPDMRFRVCYRRGEVDRVFVDLGECPAPVLSKQCWALERKSCAVLPKAVGQPALRIFVERGGVEAEGTWQLVDAGTTRTRASERAR